MERLRSRGADPDAWVVGSGPNGLAGAVELARNGFDVTVLEAAGDIGGGTRTSELVVPGVLHDHCSAVHPMATASPFMKSLDLERHGLEWCWPEIDLAHPLDDGTAGVMVRSIDQTAGWLGSDGGAWRAQFERPSATFESLLPDLMGPMVHLPRRPIRLTRFGIRALASATMSARAWHTEQAKALFGGVAAHAISPLTKPLSSSVGRALICSCHAFGWPVARGGSHSITKALAAELKEHGGKIETGREVRSLDELPPSEVVLLDLAPARAADVAGARLNAKVARAYRRYRHGPAAYKVDFAVKGGVPWTNGACRRAGTVHAVGTFDETVAAEAEISRGRMPENPFVLVGQQYLADPSRSSGDIHPIWAYAHVPSRWANNETEAVIRQIERFAPGFRKRIVAQVSMSPAEFESYNPNFIGGDIIGGANSPLQIISRPRFRLNPYATGIPGVYLCSASTPPGAGAHGMGGYNAARAALKAL
ncbi:MAG TPA: NAD(P)/FAD-dependent oxidoreductase [Solirubrobacterales bacterium]|nr:NAD(P)/FAD-dependent oxidoreductase [Solirubrobacterales bacterium]